MVDRRQAGLRSGFVLRVADQGRQMGVRLVDIEERLAPRATPADSPCAFVFRVEARVAGALASETDGTEFQHRVLS